MVYILSQVFVVIATFLIGLTFFKKDKTSIMLLCILYCVFYGTHYLMLGALTGALMTLISAIRNVWFYINAKRSRQNSEWVLMILFLITIISGMTSYQDIFSMVSISASLMSTYSVWQDDVKKYKIIALVVSVCFIVYAVHIGSVFAIITELFLFAVELIAVIKIFREGSKNRRIKQLIEL